MTRRGTAGVLRAFPKVELHLHLEGTVPPRLLSRMIARSGGRAPSRSHLRSLYAFSGFRGFLEAYGRVSRCLDSPADLRLAVVDLGRRLRREGVLHAEVFFAPDVLARNGLSYPAIVAALEHGAERVERRGGPTLRFLADGVRQWGAPRFARLVARVTAHRSPRVVGVGLGGDERSEPARRFAASFAAADRAGLAAVVHAGETGGTRGIEEALTWLSPRRIAHGIAAARSPVLLATLVRAQVALDVCLTSNRRTGAVPPGGPHPLAALVGAGVEVTLGTDDPALFRATLSGEYARALGLGLSWAALRHVAVAGAAASLLGAAQRRQLVRRVHSGWPSLRPRSLPEQASPARRAVRRA